MFHNSPHPHRDRRCHRQSSLTSLLLAILNTKLLPSLHRSAIRDIRTTSLLDITSLVRGALVVGLNPQVSFGTLHYSTYIRALLIWGILQKYRPRLQMVVWSPDS